MDAENHSRNPKKSWKAKVLKMMCSFKCITFGVAFHISLLWILTENYKNSFSASWFYLTIPGILLVLEVLLAIMSIQFLVNKLFLMSLLQMDGDDTLFQRIFLEVVKEFYFFDILMVVGIYFEFVIFDYLIWTMAYSIFPFLMADCRFLAEAQNELVSYYSSDRPKFRQTHKKIKIFTLLLILTNISAILLQLFIFYPMSIFYLSALLFYGLWTLMKILLQWNEFELHYNQLKSQNNEDKYNSKRIYFRYFLNFICIGLELIHFLQLVVNITWGFMFLPFELYLLQHFAKIILRLKREIYSAKNYISFLSNIEKNFPLVIFTEQEEKDECPICKETMLKARKLPCGHIFHQFCIIKMIENYNNKCPMCRQSFHFPIPNNQPRRQQPPQNLNLNRRRGLIINNNNNNNPLNQNDFLRMLQMVIAPRSLPINTQSIARLREMFPQYSNEVLERELRVAGSIENAVTRLLR